jgi:hypothetical protein
MPALVRRCVRTTRNTCHSIFSSQQVRVRGGRSCLFTSRRVLALGAISWSNPNALTEVYSQVSPRWLEECKPVHVVHVVHAVHLCMQVLSDESGLLCVVSYT